MAVVKQKRVQKKILEEQKRQETLKRKMEIQQKKAEFGETWRYSLSEKKKKELENIVGDIDTPRVIDSIDINNFFDPISFYKDNKNEKVDFDYQKYINAEIAYKEALKDVDSKLIGEDNDLCDESIEEFLLNSDQDENEKENLLNKIPKFLQADYMEWTKYFNRYVPLYNKFTCNCCGQILNYDDFFPQYIETNLARIQPNGKMHMSICINCCKKIYEYLFYKKAGKDAVEAMKWFCSYLNIYFDEVIYYQAKELMINNKMKNHIIYEYMQIINRRAEYKNKSFLDSNIIFGGKNENIGIDSVYDRNSNSGNTNNQRDGIIGGWSKEELKNRKLVIKMVGYDPFDYESEENRKKLYKDLLGMLEQGMEMDEVKIQAAIQIVISFLRVRELNKTYREKELTGASISELKGLSELKSKEMTTITQFSKDNGFSERYAVSKSKGENSFTGIMNKMDEQKYEDALVNKYDIATSSTIQQAADASFKAIMNQLGLGEAEIWQTCQKQLKEIENLRRENMRLEEDLRTTKYDLAKIKLLEEAKNKGTLEEDDDVDDKFGGY